MAERKGGSPCIHGCGDFTRPRSRLNECPNCRHSLYYWRRKRPAQVIERRRKLKVFGSRLDEHFATDGKESRMKTYDPAIRAKAVALLRKGKPAQEVAAQLKVTVGAVSYWRKVMDKNGGSKKAAPDRRVADAITFLRHARAELDKPASKLSRSELLGLLALDSLEH